MYVRVGKLVASHLQYSEMVVLQDNENHAKIEMTREEFQKLRVLLDKLNAMINHFDAANWDEGDVWND